MADVPVLTTERLVLRRPAPSDAAGFFEAARDERVTRFLMWKPHKKIETTRAYLEGLAREPESVKTWGLFEKEDGSFAGTLALSRPSLVQPRGEVGYWLAADRWGRGLMTEALRAVLDYAFGTLGLVRVSATHDPENPASGRVMEKAGLRREGVLRAYSVREDGVHDSVLWAVTREDWEEARG